MKMLLYLLIAGIFAEATFKPRISIVHESRVVMLFWSSERKDGSIHRESVVLFNY